MISLRCSVTRPSVIHQIVSGAIAAAACLTLSGPAFAQSAPVVIGGPQANTAALGCVPSSTSAIGIAAAVGTGTRGELGRTVALVTSQLAQAAGFAPVQILPGAPGALVSPGCVPSIRVGVVTSPPLASPTAATTWVEPVTVSVTLAVPGQPVWQRTRTDDATWAVRPTLLPYPPGSPATEVPAQPSRASAESAAVVALTTRLVQEALLVLTGAHAVPVSPQYR